MDGVRTSDDIIGGTCEVTVQGFGNRIEIDPGKRSVHEQHSKPDQLMEIQLLFRDPSELTLRDAWFVNIVILRLLRRGVARWFSSTSK